MSDTETSLWAGIFARFEASLNGLSKHLRRRNQLDTWAMPTRLPVPSVQASAGTTGGPLVCNLGSPQPGYRWRVRALQVVGLTGANGNPTYTASVVCDVYVASQATPNPSTAVTSAAAVPPPADWYCGNLAASSNPTAAVVPWEKVFGSDEALIGPGDSLIVVLSGSGVVTTTPFTVGAFVDQYQGFSGLLDTN